MTAITKSVWMPEHGDPRSLTLPLMREFWPTGVITVVYILVSYFWRKRLIARPKQTDNKSGPLQNVIIFYNWAMVAYSGMITAEILLLAFKHNLPLATCGNYEVNRNLFDMRLVRIGYAFYISKFIELLDTIFFLMRGKVDQVTFLHVFHHAAMPPSLWWGVHYSPSGIIVIFPLINSFIHVLMYTYYGLAAMGAYKYLWWKEYLTQAQMLQFAIMIVHQSQVFLPGSKCTDPKAFPAAIMAYSAIFLVLFGNFYVKAYLKKQRLAKKEQALKDSIQASKKTDNHHNHHHNNNNNNHKTD